jgi:hypothetical protein
MNFQRIDTCVLAPEVVVRRVDDWTIIAFAGMTFDRLHHGARIGIGARRSLAAIVGDAWPAIMRRTVMKFGMPTRSRSVTSATLVTPIVSRTARAADRGVRFNGAFDA